jgi:protein-disulfide isomerase
MIPTIQERLRTAATVIMALCAVLISAVAIRRAPTVAAARSLVETERDWANYAGGGHSMGEASAAVTIIEFSDFQCPFCRRFATYRDSLQTLGVDVRVVYRHFPIPTHQFAAAAARASECAANQGRFEAMHNALFGRQDSIGVASWWRFAQDAGVADSTAFELCMRSSATIKTITDDSIAAAKLGVSGTPTLLIHDVRVNGAPTFDSLLAYIRRAAQDGSR